MIVVAIIAILATIAVPNYQEYLIRSKRRAAQAEMMEIANREQQYLLANRTYANSATLGYTLPSDVAANYGFTITLGAGTTPSFVITFTPQGGQVSDGALTLDSGGTKTPTAKW